jgi:hypothetical protein
MSKNIVVRQWTPEESAPKTDGSAGTIALDSLNVAVLRTHHERRLAEREAWNRHAAEERAKGKETADWADTGKVFVDVDGAWLHPEKVSDAFRRICRRADLPPINLRNLRHCAATLIHAGGETCMRSRRRCATPRFRVPPAPPSLVGAGTFSPAPTVHRPLRGLLERHAGDRQPLTAGLRGRRSRHAEAPTGRWPTLARSPGT